MVDPRFSRLPACASAEPSLARLAAWLAPAPAAVFRHGLAGPARRERLIGKINRRAVAIFYGLQIQLGPGDHKLVDRSLPRLLMDFEVKTVLQKRAPAGPIISAVVALASLLAAIM